MAIANHLFCVAPMLEWTDRHCRYFHRLLSQRAVLYTEMVTTGALLHGNQDRFLKFNQAEHPVALQLGGSNPKDLAICAELAQNFGYDEINLNVGCPSDRVQNGRFGACLMLEPDLVADCISTMAAKVKIPVTTKTRIGVDEHDTYEKFYDFVKKVGQAGCKTFIIHARKAWLKGLSPKQNREIPPLKYDFVFQIKSDFPNLEVVINGGVTDITQAKQLLNYVDGVMVGREAYHNPYMLSEVDRLLFNVNNPPKTRSEIIEAMSFYIQKQLSLGVRLNSMTRHIIGLFHEQPGARAWRRHLSENAAKSDAGIEVLNEALAFVRA